MSEANGKPGSDPLSQTLSERPLGKKIPSVFDVPLTREEVRRRKVWRAIAIIAAIATVITAIGIAYRAYRRREIDVARTEAERTGRVAAIDRALALLDGETATDDIALAARLHAMATLAGVEAHRERAVALLAEHDATSDGASDHRIAATYLALAAGNLDAARQEASALVAGQGPRGAEAGHARALAALAVGNIDAAYDAASATLRDMPDAPRHRGLVLEIESRRSEGDVAIVPDSATSLRAAQARVRWARNLGREAALEDARAVLAADDATPAEQSWAHVILALSAVTRGDTLGATREVEEAERHTPPGDELFVIEVTEIWLSLGRIDAADRSMDRLGTGTSTDAGRRALLYARRAIHGGDAETAATMLEGVPESPERTLAEAELAALRGDATTARERFEAAARHRDLEGEARVGLSAFLLSRQQATDALAVIEPLVARDPTFPSVASAAAYAHAATGDRDGALRILEQALAAHANEPVLLAAKARVFYRVGDHQHAIEAYRAAMEVDRNDADVATERAISAVELHLVPEARENFERALELDPQKRSALVHYLELLLEERDHVRARSVLAAIDEARHTGHHIDTLRARFLVATLAGASGVTAVNDAIARHPQDGQLRVLVGLLYYQAEQWNDAADAFYSAHARLTLPANRFALGMRVLAFARARREPSVEPAITLLQTGADVTPLTPQEEALVWLSRAWMEWHAEAYGRTSIFARQALDRDAASAEALLLLSYVEHLQRRTADDRLTGIKDRSLEAAGWLATTATGDEACTLGRLYLAGAPTGRYASQLRTIVARCAP